MIRENSKLNRVSDHETNQMLRCVCIGIITLILFLSLPQMCSSCNGHGHHGHDHHHHDHDDHHHNEPASFKWSRAANEQPDSHHHHVDDHNHHHGHHDHHDDHHHHQHEEHSHGQAKKDQKTAESKSIVAYSFSKNKLKLSTLLHMFS